MSEMAAMRSAGPGGRNRTGMILTGIVLTVVGLAAIAMATGLAGSWLNGLGSPFTVATPTDPVVPSATVSLSAWFWLLLALAGVVIFVLAVAWLAAQFPKVVPVKPFRLQDDPRQGTTSIDASALEAITAETIEEITGVNSARATVRGTAAEPTLEVNVTVGERSDPQQIVQQIQSGAATDLATALDGTVVALRIFVEVNRETSSTDTVTLPA